MNKAPEVIVEGRKLESGTMSGYVVLEFTKTPYGIQTSVLNSATIQMMEQGVKALSAQVQEMTDQNNKEFENDDFIKFLDSLVKSVSGPKPEPELSALNFEEYMRDQIQKDIALQKIKDIVGEEEYEKTIKELNDDLMEVFGASK